MPPQRATAMDGFEEVKRRPQKFRCTLCAGAFIMDREGMITHAKEAGHKAKVREKNEGWRDWDVAAATWGPGAQEWGEPDAEELARWMPSEADSERQEAEMQTRERILKWLKDVEASR